MLIDGISLVGNSVITNSSVESGAAFPTTNLIQGRVFYLTTVVGSNQIGLYSYNGTTWVTGDITSVIAGLGLAGGGAGGDVTLTLGNSGIAAGTYTKITVDVTGRATVGASLASSDVTTALGFTPTNVALAGVVNGYATLDSTGRLPISQLTAAVVGAIVYQGMWNASTNTPTLASGVGTKGQYYKVNVAGTTSIDGISSWNIGDAIIFDGTTWDKLDGVATEVTSVFGRVGAVVLMSSDVTGALGFTPANIAGATFTGPVTGTFFSGSVNAAVAAAGSVIGTATPLTASISVVTSATAVTAFGVQLPICAPGMTVTIINTTAVPINVYPAATAQIDTLGNGVAFSLGTLAKLEYIGISATQWYSLTGVYA